jgi:hypothetical protein
VQVNQKYIMVFPENGNNYWAAFWSEMTLPPQITHEMMVKVAKRVERDGKFSHANLTPKHLNVMSRPKYEALRDVLINHGVLAWNDIHSPGSGLRICDPRGVQFFRILQGLEGENHSPAARAALRYLIKPQ